MNFIASLENASLVHYIINKWILFHMFFSHLITRHWYVCIEVFLLILVQVSKKIFGLYNNTVKTAYMTPCLR